jgi:N6-L-threonylcarbamoyladenine synthase
MENKKDTLILAIETSCDETSAALVKNGRELLSLEINTQIATHAEYGGVVPEVASRMHIESIAKVVDKAVEGHDLKEIDAIAVTCGPGLVGALLVGISFAKSMAYALDVPLIGVHHIDGHVCANYITNKELEPPFLSLIVSGGHTILCMVHDYMKYELIGETRDDAAGEAFDKGARLLGLPYPGGKIIDDLAKTGDKNAIKFTRSKIREAPSDFSFSGVKTQLRQYIQKMGDEYVEDNINDIAASYQQAIIDMPTNNLYNTAKEHNVKKIVLAGGVAANSGLRSAIANICQNEGIELYMPELKLCADNAAMIGSAAYFMLQKGKTSDMRLNATPQLELYDK